MVNPVMDKDLSTFERMLVEKFGAHICIDSGVDALQRAYRLRSLEMRIRGSFEQPDRVPFSPYEARLIVGKMRAALEKMETAIQEYEDQRSKQG